MCVVRSHRPSLLTAEHEGKLRNTCGRIALGNRHAPGPLGPPMAMYMAVSDSCSPNNTVMSSRHYNQNHEGQPVEQLAQRCISEAAASLSCKHA